MVSVGQSSSLQALTHSQTHQPWQRSKKRSPFRKIEKIPTRGFTSTCWLKLFHPLPVPLVSACVMPAGMFNIDSILSARPSCKEPLLLQRSAPVVLSTGLTDSIYADYSSLYTATCGPSSVSIHSAVNGTRIGYNGYYYGQLQIQSAGGGGGGGPPCCGPVSGLSPQQCPCLPTGNRRRIPVTL